MATQILGRAKRIGAGDKLGRADRKDVLLEQERRREARELARAPADERVRGAGLERFIDRIGVDQDIGLGMAGLELADPADEPGGGERRRRIDHQKAAPVTLAHGARGLGEERQSFGERSCSGRARFGQPKSAAISLDEPCAEILLERPHLLGDRRLGHVQLLGRPGERQVARDDLEGAKRVERRQAVEEVHRLAFLYDGRRRNELLRRDISLYMPVKRAQPAQFML